MKRQSSFEYARPGTIEEAGAILLEAGGRAAVLAGGTDLLVRMKRSVRCADVIVDIGGIDELARIEPRVDGLWIGTMTTAAAAAADSDLAGYFPAVSEAARQVGALQIRNMATIGGALCSGLRCQFRDQSDFWRKTLGACELDGGESCHAKPGGRCCATVACNLVPALVACGASIEIQCAGSRRIQPVEKFFTGDGSDPIAMERDELVLGVTLPWSLATPKSVGTYCKTRLRRAMDRPLVGVACCLELDAVGVIEP